MRKSRLLGVLDKPFAASVNAVAKVRILRNAECDSRQIDISPHRAAETRKVHFKI